MNQDQSVSPYVGLLIGMFLGASLSALYFALRWDQPYSLASGIFAMVLAFVAIVLLLKETSPSRQSSRGQS